MASHIASRISSRSCSKGRRACALQGVGALPQQVVHRHLVQLREPPQPR
ncbi:hypothetical protein [Streptomyces poriticola]